MVISHKFRVIYWKPHKVASTSVMHALGKQCGEHDSVGGIADGAGQGIPNQRRNMLPFSHLPTAGNHATPAQMREIVEVLWGDALWAEYHKVTVVRNPWERAVSWLDYANNELGRDVGIGEALENTERAYWFGDSGEPLADTYIRYERLDDDYRALCGRLDIPYEPLPQLRVGHRDRSRPYWEYFDADSRERIARAFDREIEHFGYQFGT